MSLTHLTALSLAKNHLSQLPLALAELRYSFYLLYWYKSTNAHALQSNEALRWGRCHSVYLLYWYKSTSTDAKGAASKLVVLTVADNLEIEWMSPQVWGLKLLVYEALSD
jgi:hypothetical protein